MMNMNVEVEIEITKVRAKVFLRIKFMLFKKAAVMGFDLMPGSVDEEHVEIIKMIVPLPLC